MAVVFSFSCPGSCYSRRSQQSAVFAYFPARRLNIRHKPFLRHHSRMKIAICALRLAEGHLYVNPELSHRTKTLAHQVFQGG